MTDPRVARTPMSASSVPTDGSPVSGLRHLADLYLRPRRFFGEVPRGRSSAAALAAAYAVGVAVSLGRVDRVFMQQDLGRPGSPFSDAVADSWLVFWGVVLGAGLLSAVLSWYLGGWWYRVRLRWSGMRDAGREDARLLFVYSHLVHALPSVLYAAVCTVLFDSYGSAWASDEIWSAALLIFPFWGIATSYRGLTLWYAPQRRALARLWFVILPAVVYVVAFGLIVVLYSLLTGGAAPSVAV